MKIRTLPDKLDLRGKRVLVRVDWNIPLDKDLAPEDTMKIEQSIKFIRQLRSRGAVTIILTHLGRPEGREMRYSTKQLVPLLLKQFRLEVAFHGEAVADPGLIERLGRAEAGTIHLLENVRFETGEEKNDARLAKVYAKLGDLFVNDAFASCHRAHASVVGIAKELPTYAGPDLVAEIEAVSLFLGKPKRPVLAIIGGLKLSTKIPVLKTLVGVCDRVLIGGAMATTLSASIGQKVGASFVEKDQFTTAKKIARDRKVRLPLDVMVAKKIDAKAKHTVVNADEIGEKDIVVDIGPKTMKAWAEEIKKAKTLLWNGPVGVVEVTAFGAGSRFLARTIAGQHTRGLISVIGGGDTLPVLFATKTAPLFTHLSMGGGALLEFIAKKGKLPGLAPLVT